MQQEYDPRNQTKLHELADFDSSFVLFQSASPLSIKDLQDLPAVSGIRRLMTMAKSTNHTALVFVYNADSGVFNAVTDMAHKAFSP